MSDEKELIKRRGSYKGRVTAFSKYFNGLNVSSLTPTDITELQLRIGKIKETFELYEEVQLQIELLAVSLDAPLAERDEFETNYYKIISKAQTIVDEYLVDRDNKSVSSSHSKHRLVKLPIIHLPKFSGAYENWLEFRDTFTSLINSNSEIDDVNKFHYLRASLEGSAALIIKSLEFSGKNYAVAWKLICERYDNKRLLIHNHVSSLFNFEQITKESSVCLRHLIDHLTRNLRALESLGEPVTHWDTLLIHMFTNKLDIKSYREWEQHKSLLDKNEGISLECFITFLRNRADFIETLESTRTSSHGHSIISTKHTIKPVKHKTMVSIQDNSNASSTQAIRLCPMCKNHEHSLNSCPQFLALSNESRMKLLPTFKVCFNCLCSGHYANRCKRQGCKVCNRKHNTMIHVSDLKLKHKPVVCSSSSQSIDNNITSGAINIAPPPKPQSNVTLSASASQTDNCADDGQYVLLSTALVKLYNYNGREYIARAVLDNGSTSCLITERMFSKLNLPHTNVSKSVLGINNALSRIDKMCHLRFKSLNEQFTSNIRCFVLPSITDSVPSVSVNLKALNIPSNVILADPNFHTPADVDLIIGADIFWDILKSQKIRLGHGKPMLLETKLGWIVSGPIHSSYVCTSSNRIKCNFSNIDSSEYSRNDDIQKQLMRFWQLEEVSPKSSSHYSKEERLCEDHFVNNTTRLADGRFCVRIPLKESPTVLGDSYQRAKHCFLSLERRNKAKPPLNKMYKDFMLEYSLLGHMSECKELDTVNSHFIPHHGVLRESSSTTKLRAVFNASSRTTSGVSLNDIQMVGAPIQDDLLSILIRFRQHKYVITADVEKMYRQVMVHPDDRYLQNILWRFNPTDPLRSYKLNTVTYGTSSGSFLATRCLKQVGLDCKDLKISEIILRDFFVDDLLTGGSSIEEIIDIRQKITTELGTACMPLRKWQSNSSQLMSVNAPSALNLNIGTTEPSKTLGLGWIAGLDQLYFPIGCSNNICNTKRGVLSVIAQIFDPLGLLAPCVIRMKLILQRLWLEKVSWDDQLSSDLSELWFDIIKSLPVLNTIRIPRHVICDAYKFVEMHVFNDASERAYGACIYIRSISHTGTCLVRLLFAKSRVAPVKPTTVPRLELCGALVGVRLFEKAISSLRLKINNVVFWTDSTIVLGWLRMLPSKLQPFVRNRVAEILEKTNDYTWRYISTNDNPADYLTRGIQFEQMQSLDLWWSGPSFLKQDQSCWPTNFYKEEETLPETRHIALQSQVSSLDNNNEKFIDFSRFSNLTRLKRSVAYVLRFVNKCKRLPIVEPYLTNDELQSALNLIIKISQRESFPEYSVLLKGQDLPKKSPLVRYNVFLDNNNILRVGGRLNNSSFNYNKKHPIILQSANRFTKLLFSHEHTNLMHAGPQLLLASIRETYWPLGGRNLAKSCFHQCIRCRRIKGQVVAPLMGSLPETRVTPGGYPFENVGVDYAGPMSAVSRQGRGSRVVKVYIALFICFATKAVHLELVGDLTSQSYLSALRRFISRRGKPQNIYSDNGTAFVGAYNEFSKFLLSNCNSLGESMVNEGIHFHFIPAYAPHFGGLWEAGVKSAKYHLVRVLGNCHLTYEELNTTLVQIEAILNSRPLTPISSDPEDLTPLTPGHFLIGRPLTSLPDRDYPDCSFHHRARFQRIQQLREHFWDRWSKEYVVELQQRTKWKTNNDPLKLNSLVVLKEDNQPPMKWRLGRVVAVIPGSDGISRVADIKTSSGIVRRAFSKICVLPEVT